MDELRLHSVGISYPSCHNLRAVTKMCVFWGQCDDDEDEDEEEEEEDDDDDDDDDDDVWAPQL